MTIDEQLRDLARRADQLQGAITVEEIVRRAAGQGDAKAAVVDLTGSQYRRRPSRWLAIAAVMALFALVAALTLLDQDQTVVTTPVTSPTTIESTTTTMPAWSGALRDSSTVVHRLAVDGEDMSWDDPLDASESQVDIERIVSRDLNSGYWVFDLAIPPANPEPGLVLAYGLVFDTNADGAADYVVGIDNDAPKAGNFRAWVTDLATGQTDMRVEPGYGFPIEFGFPSERDPRYPVFLTFLGDSRPADLDPNTVRYYAWTSAARDGGVFAHDYAPDTGWMSAR